jgi:ankyrin repeat protein
LIVCAIQQLLSFNAMRAPHNKIVAIEEEPEDGNFSSEGVEASEDIIPGPQRPAQHPSQPPSLLSRVLNLSSSRNRNQNEINSSSMHRNSIANNNNIDDELQLSTSQQKWAGGGILASTVDLALDPQVFATGCILLQAAARGDIPAIQELLTSKQTHVNFRDYDRRTALHVAASEGHLQTVQYLIETWGAKIHRSDRWGGSPLDDAHRHRHLEVVKYLRQRGAATGSGNRVTNLIQAAAEGDLDEVQMLLHFAQKGKLSNSSSSSSKKNKTKVLPLDVNQGDYDKRTALHLAAGEGHLEVVRALCKAGANVNIEDRWNRRPLDDAEAGQHADCVVLLKSYGAQHSHHHLKTQSSLQAMMNNNGSNNDNILDTSSKRAMDNMHVEFQELEMIDRIGSGAFGEIYKCRWRGTLVAAKIIKSAKICRDWNQRRVANALRKAKDDDLDVDDVIRELDHGMQEQPLSVHEKDAAIADFRQEISVLKSLRHPHIVLLLAYSTTDDYECLISELMKCSLLDVFKSHLVQGTRMPARTKIIYATQLAQGMNYLHTCKPPIIHRDLKPANLLVDHSGVLKISDFGLSKVRPDPGKNETDTFTMTGETGYVMILMKLNSRELYFSVYAIAHILSCTAPIASWHRKYFGMRYTMKQSISIRMG